MPSYTKLVTEIRELAGIDLPYGEESEPYGESLGQKLRDGFKMVFGKVRKVGNKSAGPSAPKKEYPATASGALRQRSDQSFEKLTPATKEKYYAKQAAKKTASPPEELTLKQRSDRAFAKMSILKKKL
jgi:hypothetical protein